MLSKTIIPFKIIINLQSFSKKMSSKIDKTKLTIELLGIFGPSRKTYCATKIMELQLQDLFTDRKLPFYKLMKEVKEIVLNNYEFENRGKRSEETKALFLQNKFFDKDSN